MSILIAVLMGATFGQTPLAPPATQDDAAVFAQLESIWNEAHLHGDPDVLDRLWAAELLVMVPRMSPLGKDDAMAALRSGRFKFDRYDSAAERVRVYGDVAVVAGRLHRTRRMGERVLDDDWRFTKVYVRRAGQWQVVAFHASESGE